MLAELGARLQPAPWTPSPAVYTELQQRLMQREALVDMRTQLRNQLHALCRQPRVIPEVQCRMERPLNTLNVCGRCSLCSMSNSMVHLVRTFLATLEAIVVWRNRAHGLLLRELGAFIASPDHAPAATKRLSRC